MTEEYRQRIYNMVSNIEDEKFLKQIWTILDIHMAKKGDKA